MWHRQRSAGWIIRTGGLIAIGVSIAALYLVHLHTLKPPGEVGPIDFLLALVSFLGASCGCAMLFWGAHLFDEVALSARWHRPHLPK